MAGSKDSSDEGDRPTIYEPSGQPHAASPDPSVRPQSHSEPFGLGRSQTSLRAGFVLNGMYQIKGPIGRGGMGQVYEGFNITTDEQVAIKVILPHLVDDAKARELFLKEAGILRRLNHEALVHYRTAATDPTINQLYIVTDFIDGIGLDDLIGRAPPPSEERMRGLIRRMAEGLMAAHALGAIHRDISPSNILAPGGRLDAAVVIDFGIAKDLQTSKATIGESFAGRLGFAAPEQLGDFGGQVGEWTDVYGLGMTMLALASGKAPDMGSTYAAAVDRRRAGPDLSGAPAGLQPLFAHMLAGDPERRLRSMRAVIEAVDAPATLPAADHTVVLSPPLIGAAVPTPGPTRPPPVKRPPPPSPAAAPSPDRSLRMLIYGAGAGAAALAIGLIAWIATQHHGGPAAAPPQTFDGAVEKAVMGASCAWLEYDQLGAASPVTIPLVGAAENADQAAAYVSEQASTAAPAQASADRVLTLPSPACDVVNALRRTRATASNGDVWMKVGDKQPMITKHPECGAEAAALVHIDGDLGPQDAALAVVGPDGKLRSIFNGRSQAATLGKSSMIGDASLTGNSFSISLCPRTPGVYGLALVRGPSPMTLGLPRAESAAGAAPDALGKTLSAPAAQGWRTQMVWYQVQPGPPSPPPTNAVEPPAASAPVSPPPEATPPRTRTHQPARPSPRAEPRQTSHAEPAQPRVSSPESSSAPPPS